MRPIYVLNGPNLNRLGKREPAIYGTTTLAQVEQICRAASGERSIVFHQTNSEEKLIDLVHEAIDECAGIIINPAAFTFTSLALLLFTFVPDTVLWLPRMFGYGGASL